MPDTNCEPQLAMRRDDLLGLPPVELPEGYSIRHFQPGDEANWDRIIAESFSSDNAPWRTFGQMMAQDPAFRPDRVLFVLRGDEAVGTASAWHVAKHGDETGYVHYVGVLPSEAGKGLGYQVSLACLHKMVSDGRTSAILHTDDFRVPAIKTYLKLGFHPVLVHENQRDRWRDLFRKLDRPDLAVHFAHILEG